MDEFLSALAVLWCSVTYWLGGQEIPWTKRGYKWIRRYVMPIGLCIFLIVLHAIWWKAVLACTGLSGATHLGYGVKDSNAKFAKLKAVFAYAYTGLLMGGFAWILCYPHWNWMIGFPFTYHTAYGAISLKWDRFRWAFVGELVGIGIGIAYITSLSFR